MVLQGTRIFTILDIFVYILLTLQVCLQILFGFLSDCFPIFGFKRRPYIILGWVMCLFTLLCLAREGNDISASNVVVLLSVCNLCYVFADTSGKPVLY